MFPSKRNRSFAAEWDPQDGVMIAWPHLGTDWAPMIDEVTACYVELTRAILEDEDERVVIVTNDPADVRTALGPDTDWDRIIFAELPTNDTWVRDYGPITVSCGGHLELADFTFNAWGMKFAADCDNLVTSQLAERGIFRMPLANYRDLVLEGNCNGTPLTVKLKAHAVRELECRADLPAGKEGRTTLSLSEGGREIVHVCRIFTPVKLLHVVPVSDLVYEGEPLRLKISVSEKNPGPVTVEYFPGRAVCTYKGEKVEIPYKTIPSPWR